MTVFRFAFSEDSSRSLPIPQTSRARTTERSKWPPHGEVPSLRGVVCPLCPAWLVAAELSRDAVACLTNRPRRDQPHVHVSSPWLRSVWSSLERALANFRTRRRQAGRWYSPVAARPSRTSLPICSARSGASGREIDRRSGGGLPVTDSSLPHPSGSWRSIVTIRHDYQNVETTGHPCVRPGAARCIA